MRGFPQDVAFACEARLAQRGDRLFDEGVAQTLSPAKAVDRNERALVALGVLAGALAKLLGGRLSVENVVGDLERRPSASP